MLMLTSWIIFIWGLGIVQDEAFALWQGLKTTKGIGAQSLILGHVLSYYSITLPRLLH